jgi:hypothetical protein
LLTAVPALLLALSLTATAQDSGLTVETEILPERPTILGPATVQTAPRPCRSYCVTP